MKSRIIFLKFLLIALVAGSYSWSRDVAAANDKVDKAWQGSPSSRTWVITSIDEPPPSNFHFEVGDAFRIEKGAVPQFAPLSRLRSRWGVQYDIRIQLEKTRGANPRFCADFNVSHKDQNITEHRLIIDPPGHGRNSATEMELAIIDPSDEPCELIIIPNHGGRAHAEN